MGKVKEPKIHHYIPQFILRNFNDSDNQVSYWDIVKKTLEKRNTRSVFMDLNLYRDEKNNPDNPTDIETKFSIFEHEISDLLAKKILNAKEIVLTRKELESLRLFTSLLSFRSDSRMKQYKDNLFDQATREVLLEHQPDGDFLDLWKKELRELTAMRTYEELEQSNAVDPIIKLEFKNDFEGYYLSFAEARGGEFLISDIYPTSEMIPITDNKTGIHLHFLFPLSSSRIMILNHIMFKKELNNDPYMKSMVSFSKIKGEMIKQPMLSYINNSHHDSLDTFSYKVKKIYQKDVEYMNSLCLNEARVGVTFKDKERIRSSISSFDLIEGTKQKYVELENAMKQ